MRAPLAQNDIKISQNTITERFSSFLELVHIWRTISMTTKEVADKLVELCRQGKNLEAPTG